jgi:uncharacterized protein YbaP (TraB family)
VVKRLAVLAMFVIACRGHESPPQRAGSAQVAVGSAAAADPWAVTPAPSPNAPPSLAERHAFAEAACPKVTGPYFFRVEKAGKTSYILGTRHISVPLAKFPDVVRDKLHAAKLAVFEVAPEDHSSVEREPMSLSKAVGPALWHHYGELVGEDMARSLERGRASTALIMSMVLYEDVGAMLDVEIEHEVATAGIPAKGLETSAFQDDLLDKLLDLRMFKVELEQTKDRKEIEQDSHDDLAQYCAGTDDSPGTDDKSRAMFMRGGYTKDEIDHMDDLMVFQRNARWIPRLEELFATGDVFVAVGADHLIGDKGVVALLRGRGFTVTRITQ